MHKDLNELDTGIIDAIAESGGQLSPRVVILYDPARCVFEANLTSDDTDEVFVSGEGETTALALADLAAKEAVING